MIEEEDQIIPYKQKDGNNKVEIDENEKKQKQIGESKKKLLPEKINKVEKWTFFTGVQQDY